MKDFRTQISVLLFLLPLLSACGELLMQSVYLTGEVESVFRGRFQQEAVIELVLEMENTQHTIRVPVSCRSFVHPVAGSRVTRLSPDLYETRLPSQETIYLRIKHECAKADAAISLADSAFVRIYRVRQNPVHVVGEWAIPISHPLSNKASFKVHSLRVDMDDKTANARPLDRDKPNAVQADKDRWQSFTAIYAFRVPKEDSAADALLMDTLRKSDAPKIVQSTEVGTITNSVHTRKSIPFMWHNESFPDHVSMLLAQVPARSTNNDNLLILDPESSGKRYFYESPPRAACLNDPKCRTTNKDIQLGNFVAQRAGFLMLYEPTEQELLWVQEDWISLPVK